ncbi:MAG TPA: hypothetical protein VM489_16650 [Burkholderiales bacterium]|jgi:hypothetical protein|nr:hypothetical protein [Burkholderiales bacterium]
MELVDAALFAAILGILYRLVQFDRTRLSNPRYVRNMGAVVGREQVRPEPEAEVIGTFDGREIYASVQYMGMKYRFDRVVPPSYQYRVAPRELYVAPGLLYLTD